MEHNKKIKVIIITIIVILLTIVFRFTGLYNIILKQFYPMKYSEYVEKYSSEMYATLLMPAGVTSMTSILYKNESELLKTSENPDETYINEILPQKMRYNLEYIKNFNFFGDIKIMLKTVKAVISK